VILLAYNACSAESIKAFLSQMNLPEIPKTFAAIMHSGLNADNKRLSTAALMVGIEQPRYP
jgi:hypothetical protein